MIVRICEQKKKGGMYLNGLLNIYTVSFFGHREVTRFAFIEKQLIKIIKDLLDANEYVVFLVGRNGEFDQLVSSVIHRVKRLYGDNNCFHTLVLPYRSAEYRDNKESFNEFYDDVENCNEFGNTHFKAAIQKRNRLMVDRSDLTVFYIEHEYGGAYKTYKYAVRQQKKTIKLTV